MITLNDVRLPDNVIINSVEFSVLPPIENNLIHVRGKDGAYLFNQELDAKVFTIRYTLVADEVNEVMKVAEDFAEWLHHKEPVKVVFDDTPHKYYMVVPDGETNITEIANIGQGEFRLICTEPYAYGVTKVVEASPAEDEIVYFNVDGNVGTYPQIELHVKEDITSLGLTSDDGYVLIGEPHNEEETPTNLRPRVFKDLMENEYGWATASQVDDGVVYGKFTSYNGMNIVQENGDYGTNPNGWSGASGIASLDKPVKNFEATIRLGLQPQGTKEMGRVHMYLLDQNHRAICRTSFYNQSTKTKNPRFRADAGDRNDRHNICNTPYADGKQWASRFYGVARIGRIGQKWYAYCARYNSTTRTYRNEYYTEWYDYENKYSDNLASAVQIHIGRYKNYKPVDYMFIADVEVRELLEIEENEEIIPVVAEAGDVLRLDMERAILYKNDEVFYEGLNPASTFFKLRKGMNGIGLTSDKVEMKITYPERWY